MGLPYRIRAAVPLVALCLVVAAHGGRAAVLLTFEPQTLGALAGQDGWVTTAAHVGGVIDVQNGLVLAGTRSAGLVSTVNGQLCEYRRLTAAASVYDVTWTFHMTANLGSNPCEFRMANGADTGADAWSLQVYGNGNVYVVDGGGVSGLLGWVSGGTTHDYRVQVDGGGVLRVWLDGGLVHTGTPAAPSIDRVLLSVQNTATLPDVAYWDNIAVPDAPSVCTPVTSWSRTVNGALNGADRWTAIAATPGGDVVVAGTTDGGAWIASRMDAAGAVTWTVTGGGAPGLGSTVRGVAVDPSDNVVLAIEDDRSDIGQGRDWLIAVLDPFGVPLWSTPYASAGAGDDAPRAVAIDQFASIVVVGYTAGGAAGEQWLVRKYATSLGAPLWQATFDGPVAGGNDRATAVDIDNSGKIFVAGTETTAAQGTNWRIRAYDVAGTFTSPVFAAYDNPDSTDDVVSALTADGFGRVIVAGAEDRAGLGEGWNWRVTAYNPAGGQIWSDTYHFGGGDDVAYAVAVDGCGNVLASGSSDWGILGGGLGHATRKWGPDGQPLWNEGADGGAQQDDEVLAATVLPSGEHVTAGYVTRNDTGQGENFFVRASLHACAGLVASLAITPPAPGLCQPFTVTMTVTNTGHCLLSGLDAAAPPPRIEGPAAFVSGPSTASANPFQAVTYSWAYRTTAVGTITISATATGLRQDTGAVVEAPSVAAAAVTVAGPPGPPDVDVVAGQAPAFAIPGQPATYRIDLQNVGADTALGVTMWDSLPAGLAYVGCTGAPCGLTGGVLVWNVGTLRVAATARLTYTVITPGAGTCGSIFNTGDFGEYVATDWTNVCGDSFVPDRWAGFLGLPAEIRNAVLSPAVTVSAAVAPQGGTVTYTLGVSNLCGDTAVNVTAWDTVPAGAQFLSCAGAGCVFAGGLVTWTLPDLAPLATFAVTFTVSITGAGPVIPGADAFVRADNTGGQPQPAVQAPGPTVVVRNPVLEVVKTGPAEAMTHERVTWTITVRNTGTDTAAGVVVTDSLPVPMTFTGASGGGAATGRLVTWALPDLPPGAQAAFTVTAAGPGTEDEYAVTNVAFAAASNSAGYRLGFASAPAALLLTPRLIVRVFPVPFDPATAYRGVLKFSGLPDGAVVKIFTTGGLLVRELTVPVRHRLEWDGRNTDGTPVAAGAYLYLIAVPGADVVRGNFGVLR